MGLTLRRILSLTVILVGLCGWGLAAPKEAKKQPLTKTTAAQKVSPGAKAKPKSVPPPQTSNPNENDAVKEHAGRTWRLMTYPANRIPSQPLTKAQNWIKSNVGNSEAWD